MTFIRRCFAHPENRFQTTNLGVNGNSVLNKKNKLNHESIGRNDSNSSQLSIVRFEKKFQFKVPFLNFASMKFSDIINIIYNNKFRTVFRRTEYEILIPRTKRKKTEKRHNSTGRIIAERSVILFFRKLEHLTRANVWNRCGKWRGKKNRVAKPNILIDSRSIIFF